MPLSTQNRNTYASQPKHQMHKVGLFRRFFCYISQAFLQNKVTYPMEYKIFAVEMR